MPRRRFWNGFAAGATAGAGVAIGALLVADRIGHTRSANVVRLQKTLQIGRPVNEVFGAWASLGQVQQWSSIVRNIERTGNHSHWVVDIEGRRIEWDAEVEQYIPNQAIGWKSLRGPKHTGRISFSPLGNDTLVSVTMNYSPRFRIFRPFAASISERIESYVDQVLRDFKAMLEGRPGSYSRQPSTARATGTFGGFTEPPQSEEHTRFSAPSSPLDASRPVESKS